MTVLTLFPPLFFSTWGQTALFSSLWISYELGFNHVCSHQPFIEYVYYIYTHTKCVAGEEGRQAPLAGAGAPRRQWAARPVGGSVVVRIEPRPCFSRNEPSKNGFWSWRHLLSEPFAMGMPGRQVSWKIQQSAGAALQVHALKQGWNPLEGGGFGRKSKVKKNICVLFIYSEPRNLPIILYITRCLGKSCSETIFVTRENQACAFVPLGESMKHFFP